MAINPATGLEDPNYTPPAEDIPEVPETGLLSDQSGTIEEGQDALGDITTGALADLGAVTTTKPDYEGSNAETIKEDAAIESGDSYISPASTVSGQLQSLLDSDSEYMKTADRRAKEQAASLGLLGSSAAVGASERAARETALPVAQADAKTYATAALAEQQVYNEVSRMVGESDLSAIARGHIFDISTETAKANATFNQIAEQAKAEGNMVMETTLSEIKNQWDSEVKISLANLESQLRLKEQNNEISAREREYASNSSSQIMAGAYGTINDLLGNADFMAGYAGDPTALTQVFNNFIGLAKNQTEFIGATAGLGDEYFGYDENGNETGYGSLIGSWTTIDADYVDPNAPTEV